MPFVALCVYFDKLNPVFNYIFLIYNGFIKLIKIKPTKRQHYSPSEAMKQAKRGEAKRGGAFTRGKTRHACDASTIARQRPPIEAPRNTGRHTNSPPIIARLFITCARFLLYYIAQRHSPPNIDSQRRQPTSREAERATTNPPTLDALQHLDASRASLSFNILTHNASTPATQPNSPAQQQKKQTPTATRQHKKTPRDYYIFFYR